MKVSDNWTWIVIYRRRRKVGGKSGEEKVFFFPFLNDFGWLFILVVKVSIIGRGSWYIGGGEELARVLVLGEDVLSQKRRLSEPPLHYNQTYSCRAKFYSMRFINQSKINKNTKPRWVFTNFRKNRVALRGSVIATSVRGWCLRRRLPVHYNHPELPLWWAVTTRQFFSLN